MVRTSSKKKKASHTDGTDNSTPATSTGDEQLVDIQQQQEADTSAFLGNGTQTVAGGTTDAPTEKPMEFS